MDEYTEKQKRVVESAVKRTLRLWASIESENAQETDMVKPQIIKLNGSPAFAVLPWEEYQALVTQAALKDSGTQIPDKVRIALGNGDSIIRAWRGYLGISQGELASRAGIAQYAFALMEKPNADIDEESLSKLASALGVSVDQLRTKL